MSSYAMVIDVSRCVGCYNCFLACRDEHVGVDHAPFAVAQPETGHRWIDVQERERGSCPRIKVTHTPLLCLHCQDAPCLSAARNEGITRRADGIVIIDPVRAAGQRDLVAACPYGAIYWNEAANTAVKCTFCAHLLDEGWKQPRCVEVCPTQALIFGDLSDSSSVVAQQVAAGALEELRPELRTQPRVRYRHLPQRFVAGEVMLADEPDQPAPGIQVTLSGGSEVLRTTTDNYGEFEFTGLTSDKPYQLAIEHPGYGLFEVQVAARSDENLGVLRLERH